MQAENPERAEVKIVYGAIVVGEEVIADGITLTMRGSMQVDPPEPMFLDILSRNDAISETIKVTGMCKTIDASVFKGALKGSES